MAIVLEKYVEQSVNEDNLNIQKLLGQDWILSCWQIKTATWCEREQQNKKSGCSIKSMLETGKPD